MTLLAIDAGVKSWAGHFLPKITSFSYPYGGIGVFENLFGISFSLNRVENKGAAWGLFAEHSKLLIFVRCVLVLVLMFYALFWNKDAKKNLPLLLIITGATGNILDYFLYGHVIDLFHFNFWGYTFPLFNIADSLICIGVFLMFLPSLFVRKKTC